MEKVLEQKIEAIIKSSLKQGSIFCLRDDIRFIPNANATENKEEVVQLLLANGKLTLQDCFLLSAIHSLGNSTAPIIVRKLAMEKRRNPEQDIPCYDSRSLKRRLKVLVQYGLLYSFSYDTEEHATTVVVYRCTMLGWRVFRTKLMQQNIAFDKLSHYLSTSDVFRKLTANSVAFSFAADERCGGVILNENILYGEGEKPKKLLLYARTSLSNDSIKRRYIIEPVYFMVESEVLSEEQNLKYIEDRISQLQDMIEYYIEKEEWDVRLVFALENLEGLLKLLSILKQKEMNFFMKYATFTAENVIANNNYRLDTSFLKMVTVNGKNMMKLDLDSII